MVKLYRDSKQDGKIGITLNTDWWEPRRENNEADQAKSDRAMEFLLGMLKHIDTVCPMAMAIFLTLLYEPLSLVLLTHTDQRSERVFSGCIEHDILLYTCIEGRFHRSLNFQIKSCVDS